MGPRAPGRAPIPNLPSRLPRPRTTHATHVKNKDFRNYHAFLVVSIPACHAENPGSLPGRGVSLVFCRFGIYSNAVRCLRPFVCDAVFVGRARKKRGWKEMKRKPVLIRSGCREAFNLRHKAYNNKPYFRAYYGGIWGKAGPGGPQTSGLRAYYGGI